MWADTINAVGIRLGGTPRDMSYRQLWAPMDLALSSLSRSNLRLAEPVPAMAFGLVQNSEQLHAPLKTHPQRQLIEEIMRTVRFREHSKYPNTVTYTLRGLV
jgi:hypothetical protein